jgi:hypothetical protein
MPQLSRYLSPLAHEARRTLAGILQALPGDSRQIGPPRKVIPSTAAWIQSLPPAEADLHRYHAVFPEQPVQRRMPIYADPPIQALFDQMKEGIIKAGFVAEIHRGRYWGHWFGYILSDADELFFDLSPPPGRGSLRIDPKTHHAFEQLKLPPLIYEDKTIAAINTLFCANFHHWLIDTLPKFALILDAGIDLKSIDLFIFDYRNTKYHNQVLEKLGIPTEKVLRTHPDMHIQARNLIIPSYTEPGPLPELFDYSPRGIQFVRDLFLQDPAPEGSYAKRILVSRQKAKVRRLMSEPELFPILQEKYGFSLVILEDYPVVEQAQIFHQAELIIFPHGGGLANSVFCQPGTKIIELFMPKYLPTFMMPLSHGLQLDYYALVGDPNEQDDIYIKPQRILDIVEEILK